MEIKIKRCYHVQVIDESGKEVASDYVFGSKEKAYQAGEEMIADLGRLYEELVQELNAIFEEE